MEVKSFSSPDETRSFKKGKLDVVEKDCKAGDVSLLPSGHDAWVIGNEPVIVVDFQGMIDYAKQAK